MAQAAWQSRVVQALIESQAECHALDAAWQEWHLVQALIEIVAETEVLKPNRYG